MRVETVSLWAAILTTLFVFLAPAVHGFHTICYWTVWSQEREKDYSLKVNNIDPFLCSHLVYAFGILGDDLTIDLNSRSYPLAESSVRTLNNHKNINTNLKTLISVGGSSERNEALLPAVANAQTLTKFAENCVKFCRQWNFDGVDIDWEYPENRTDFTLLIQAIRKAFDQENLQQEQNRLILTAAVSVAASRIRDIYDVPALNDALDFFNVMAYDFHGGWGKIAGFNSPLYSRLSDPKFEPSLSAAWSIDEYIRRGASPSKLVLGLASYGRAFGLEDKTRHDVGAPIVKSTMRGEMLDSTEYRSISEVCDFINNKRGRYHYDTEQRSEFAYTIDFWIGFDGPRAFQEKTQYALDKNLGGVLIWTLDYDDVSGNHCNFGVFPLTKAVVNTINKRTSLNPQKPLSLYEPILDLPKQASNTNQYRRVCYFTNWSTKRNVEDGMFLPEQIDPTICTHLIFAYAFVDEVAMSVLPFYYNDESISDRKTGLFQQFNQVKRLNPSLRTLLSIGGSTAGTRAFDIISRDDNSRRTFAANVIEYLSAWGFDGVEINWSFPGNPPATKQQLTFLLKTLREEMDKYSKQYGIQLILCISAASENPTIQEGYEISQISKHVDFINLVTYTFSRSENVTYHAWPLKKSSSDPPTATQYQEWSVDQWINGGAPADKLTLGIAGMGRSFTLADTSVTTPGAPTTGQPPISPTLRTAGYMAQYEICDLIKQGAKETIDSDQVIAYSHLDNLWVSYDNVETIKQKMEWLKEKGLSGFSFWTLDYDDFNGTHCDCKAFPLLTRAKKILDGELALCKEPTTPAPTTPAPTTSTRGVQAPDSTTRGSGSGTQKPNTRAPPGIIVVEDGESSAIAKSYCQIVVLTFLCLSTLFVSL